MFLIPLVRSSRSIVACTILPNNPILAISISELVSYSFPFINNNYLNSMNDMVLFLFYYYIYNDSALIIINKFKNKYINFYKFESIILIFYLYVFFIY